MFVRFLNGTERDKRLHEQDTLVPFKMVEWKGIERDTLLKLLHDQQCP